MDAGLTLAYEARYTARGIARLAGVDEAGRGPLCGPVTAAAVILDPDRLPEGLDDSKKLTAARRAALAARIRETALGWAVAHASVEEIDRLNILRASHLAMCRALVALPVPGGGGGGGRCAVGLHRRRLDPGQGDARRGDGGFGATAPRLRLGPECRIRHERPSGGASKSWCDPTP